MAGIERRAPLTARLNSLAERFVEQALEPGADAAQHAGFLCDHAASLREFARQLDEEYVRWTEDDEIPTAAQGVALARFLRPAFRDARTGAHLSRSGVGLPEDYLSVRLSDGYEGGIAPDGRVST